MFVICLLLPIVWGERNYVAVAIYALLFPAFVWFLFNQLQVIFCTWHIRGIFKIVMEDVIKGFGLILKFQNILLIFGGVLIGVLVGALPGLSSPMVIINAIYN